MGWSPKQHQEILTRIAEAAMLRAKEFFDSFRDARLPGGSWHCLMRPGCPASQNL
jgi:hypothetical protein